MSLVENAEMLTHDADFAISHAEKFYLSIAYMMDLRQSTGKKGNDENTLEELREAEKAVKDNADIWFLIVGTRPAKPGKEDKGLRPAYGVT